MFTLKKKNLPWPSSFPCVCCKVEGGKGRSSFISLAFFNIQVPHVPRMHVTSIKWQLLNFSTEWKPKAVWYSYILLYNCEISIIFDFSRWRWKKKVSCEPFSRNIALIINRIVFARKTTLEEFQNHTITSLSFRCMIFYV